MMECMFWYLTLTMSSCTCFLRILCPFISRWWFDDEPEDLWRTQNVISFACFMLMSLHYFGETACCPLTTDSRHLSERIVIFFNWDVLKAVNWKVSLYREHNGFPPSRCFAPSTCCWGSFVEKGSMSLICYMPRRLQYSGGTAVLSLTTYSRHFLIPQISF